MRILWLAVLLLLVALSPPAGAMAGALSLTSPDDLLLSGDALVVAPQGQLRAVASEGLGGVFHGVTGTLTVWRWTAAGAYAAAEVFPIQMRLDPARAEDHALENATLRWAAPGPATFVAVAREDGAIEARGPVEGAGRPAWVQGAPDRIRVVPEQPGAPEDVATSWREGWPFVGRWPFAGSEAPGWRGFPLVDGAQASTRGRVDLALQGGELRFVDAEGRSVSVDLGPEPAAPLAPGASVERRARAVFHGTIGGAALDMPAEWGLAAPDVRVSFVGDAQWTHATGDFVGGAGRVAFDHALVEGRGGLELAAAPVPGLDGVDVLRYRASGEWETLRIDGAPLDQAAQEVSPAVAGAWIGAALLGVLGAYLEATRGVLGRALAALYVRLSPSDLLSHPLRARILAVVKANPGIHLRRLHRDVEGAWGTFNFHVHMLQQGGHLRLRREGGFTLVFAAEDGRGLLQAIPHPTAREIHAVLPEDGTTVGVSRLRERIGVSRQLLDHHLRRLRSQGLVELVAPKPGVERLVRRRDP